MISGTEDAATPLEASELAGVTLRTLICSTSHGGDRQVEIVARSPSIAIALALCANARDIWNGAVAIHAVSAITVAGVHAGKPWSDADHKL